MRISPYERKQKAPVILFTWRAKFRSTSNEYAENRFCNINPSGSGQNGNVYSSQGKSPTLTTNKWEWPKILQLPRGANKWGIFEKKTPTLSSNSRSYNNLLHDGYCLRRLTPIECERLQTLPDDYTAGVSNSQRYKMLWNGRTVDVIAHILKHLDF